MLNEQFLRRLEQLRIAIRKRLSGGREGGTPLRSAGGALEFKSHRNYAPGDEFRSIDWNIFARTNQIQVKEFVKDEALTVGFLIDRSPSMSVGSPSKGAYARELTAALAMIALEGSHTVVLHGSRSPHFRGKESLRDLSAAMEWIPALSREGWYDAMNGALRAGQTRGVLFVLSDLWEMEGFRQTMAVSAAAGNQIALLHLLSRDEATPPHAGKVALTDAETGERKVHFITEEERAAYRRLLDGQCEEWRRASLPAGIFYRMLTTDLPLEEAVLVTLRSGGIIE